MIAAARQGDDAMLRRVLEEFRKEGFEIEGAHEAAGSLTLPLGLLGRHKPAGEHREDIERALTVARAIGRLDVGLGRRRLRGSGAGGRGPGGHRYDAAPGA